MANRHGVERLVSRLAGFVALLVSLAPPVLITLDEYGEATARLEVEAELQAKALTAFVARNPAAWQLPTDRIQALLQENRTLAGTVRVLDRDGEVIARAGAPTEWPVMARQAELFDFGRPVGMVEVTASGWSVLYHAIAILAASLVLGSLIYGPLRRIPLRAFGAATRELEASEARYRLLVEHAPVGIVMHRHGTIEFANPAFARMVGAGSVDDLVGSDILEFVVPEQRGEVAGMLVMLSGGTATLPFRPVPLMRRDGVVLETEMAGVSNPEGKAWNAQMIVTDVTDQRLAQEFLRRSRDQLLAQQRALLAITRSDLFATGDGNAMFRSITEVAAKQQGVERVGLWRFTQSRDAILCLDLYERGSDRHSSGGALRVEAYPRYLEAIRGEEVIVADDALTDELTRELADSYLRPQGIGSMLDVPIRLRGVTEGVLCHEHVGPAISWTLEQRVFAVAMGNLAALALEQETRQRAEEEAYALIANLERRLMDRSAELEAALEELEAVTRTMVQDRRVVLEDVDLGALARQAFARLKEREPDRRGECVVHPGLSAHCDWTLMQIALGILLAQAWRASSGAQAPRIEVGEAKVDGERAFFVRGNGAGSDGESVGKLSGLFQGSHESGEAGATGLGLATAGRFIARHGGRVWAEGGPEGGAVFWFTLAERPDR